MTPSPHVDPTLDRRVQRTRQALLTAFFGLVLERRYAQITVGDIIERAAVGRSTFYEHFASKNAILACSLEAPFAPLADCAFATDDTRLAGALQHFWENRAMARALLAGPMRAKVGAVLAQMIERRLGQQRLAAAHSLLIPARLAAIQLAESLLAPTTAWLAGAESCTPPRLAQALRAGSGALLAALAPRLPHRVDHA